MKSPNTRENKMHHARKELLLIQPWISDFYITDCRTQPIGLCFIASAVKKYFPHISVAMLDCLSDTHKENIAWPNEFEYLKPYFGHPDSGPFSLFHKYYRFGMPIDSVITKLKETSPFLIGISSLFTPYYRDSLKMASLCKNVFPDIPVVLGGNHASMHPASLLEYKDPDTSKHVCDYVIRGEGETTLCLLIKALHDNSDPLEIPNIIGRKNLDKSSSPLVFYSRDNIAMPDFSDLPKDKYRYEKKYSSVLFTSRSCPHRCSFCTVHEVFGTGYHAVPADRIVREIKRLWETGIRHFDIEDDNFTYDKERALALLDGIIGLKIDASFSAMNGLSYLSLDKTILSKMKSAGFSCVNLAFVSADAQLRCGLNRPHTRENFLEVIDWANSAGLSVGVSCILGFPGQTVAEIWKTLSFLAGIRCLIQPSPFYFTPGSELYRRTKDDPDIKLASKGKDPFLSARLTAMDMESEEFSREDIYTLWKLSRVLNYLKKGLDLGLNPENDFFRPAVEILKNKKWTTSSKYGSRPLPFSKKVGLLLKNSPIHVCGHRSSNFMNILP